MSITRRKMSILLIPLLALIIASCATIGGKRTERSQVAQIEKVESAIEVINELANIPEEGIPEELMRNAYGITIIPRLIKAAFGIGGQYGRGVLVVRDQEGEWSNPSFITIAGGSFGWQIGVQSADIILVFKSRKSIEDITKGTFTLGVDAGVAAGPVGRRAGASTDIELKAEIYTYSRSRGVFAGISIEGASIRIDNDANAVFYENSTIHATDIFMNKAIKAPAIVEKLKNILAEYTRR